MMAVRGWLIVTALGLAPPPVRADDAFGPSPLAPADYVLEKLERHPIVLLGEAHWVRHDALLVADLVPRLAAQGIVLAVETVRASDQAAIDRLVSEPVWEESAAMRVMRSAAWPYREYLDILRAAWDANRAAAGTMRVLALAPDPDWRETLLRVRGISYDAFMADRIAAEVAEGRRVLVYCGVHHAFTRYHQPELDLGGRATAFFDRTGNILRRRFGERVFLITLHRPVWCGKEPWSYCLPLDGAIDCAASEGGRAVGFDVAGSDFADRPVDRSVYYAHGYAGLRFGEMTDGYIWTRPIEDYENVSLIPLSEFAPDEVALRDVAARNPFSDEQDPPTDRLRAIWSEEEKRRTDPLAHRRWEHLKDWRRTCRSAPSRDRGSVDPSDRRE
jgi:hypothetical protein